MREEGNGLMACCPIFWPLGFYGKAIIPLWSRWGVGMGGRWEKNWTILVLRETVGCPSTSSRVKMSRSSHESLAMWPWVSYLTKNGANGMTVPFGSHGRLEQDNSWEVLGSVSCTWCSVVLSEGQQVLEGIIRTCPLQVIKTISSYKLDKNLSISLWSPNHLRPIFTLPPSVSEEIKCPCNPRFLHSVTVGSTFNVSLVLTLSASMDIVILSLKLLLTGSNSERVGVKASERHPLSIPALSQLVGAKYPLPFLIFTQITSQQPL